MPQPLIGQDRPIPTARRISAGGGSSVTGILGRQLSATAEDLSVSLNKRRVLEEGVELDRAKLRFKQFATGLESEFGNAEDHLALPKQTQEAIDKQIETMAKGLPASVRENFGIYAGEQGLSIFNKSKTASVKIGNERYLGGLESRKGEIKNIIVAGADDKSLFGELDNFKKSVDAGKELGALSPEAAEKEKRAMVEIIQTARLERDFNAALKSDEGGVDKNGDGIIMMPVQNFTTVIDSKEYDGATLGAVQSVRDQILSAYIQQEEARDKFVDDEIADNQAVNKGVLLAGMPGSNIPGQTPTTLASIYTAEAQHLIDAKDVPGLIQDYNIGLASSEKDLKEAREARQSETYEDTLNLINLADEEPEVYMTALKMNQGNYKATDFAKLQDEIQVRIDKREKATRDGKGAMEKSVTAARKSAREAMAPVWGDKSIFSMDTSLERKNDARRNLGASIAEEAIRQGQDPDLAVSAYIRQSLRGEIRPDILRTAVKVEKFLTSGEGPRPTRRELSEHLLYLNMKNSWESQGGTGGPITPAGTKEDLTKTIEESQESAMSKLLKMFQGQGAQ